MTVPGHSPHLFMWRRHDKIKTSGHKVHVKNGDIDQWRKQVEMASEFAVSEVFSHKKPQTGSNSLTQALQSTDLRDHDDAYSEAQAVLSDWLSSKLRRELEMEEDDDDLMCSAERRSPVPLADAKPAAVNNSNFDDLYSCLTMEEEHGAVKSFLQDLMEREVLDCAVMEELALDVGQTRKKFRDPIIKMEARHLQVRENRAQREAERQRKQRERDAEREAREEAKRREQREEARRKKEAQRQDEMLQQEMVRLRRQMEERRRREKLAHQRERVRIDGQRATRSLLSAPPLPLKHQEEKIQAMVHMQNLKCLQRHFFGWHSLVLDRRLRMSNAIILYDWKRKLKAWRGWRAVVWAEQKHREVARTEQELRAENRRCLLAVESDRRRLLQGCLTRWQLWCRMEKEQRELLAQQQETRCKMAALINAVSTGKLKATETPNYQPVMAAPEVSNQPETKEKEDHHRPGTLDPSISAVPQNKTSLSTVTQPTQPWQVSRRHTAPTAAQIQEARQRVQSGGSTGPKRAASPGSRFENRYAVQQQIITQQRKLLKDQQEQITRLREEQSMIGLEQEMEKTAQFTQLSMLGGLRQKSPTFDPTEQRAPRVTAQPDSLCTPQRAVNRQTHGHSIITAMEARARQRAERRKEIEELKRKKEEEKLAEMKAAEEQRQWERDEEKRKAAEKKKEEKRQEREKEKERQRQLKRQQELLTLARQNYNRNLLLWQGLVPWKRLIHLRKSNLKLAERHHNLFLLRLCTLGWQQSAKESLSEREAAADQLYQHFLLRRSLSCWKRLRDWRMIQEERAERFYRTHILRRFLLAMLDHVTQERLVEWDHWELAQEHNNRRLLQRWFQAWRQLPCLLRKEREKEERRERLGRKVAEVLPDFIVKPPAEPVTVPSVATYKCLNNSREGTYTNKVTHFSHSFNINK